MERNSKVVFTNHPFSEGVKDKPIFINDSLIGKFIYPDTGQLDYSDINYMYLSTDNITVCIMEIGPGGFFNPPDYHPGDEAYFILQGEITQFNPLNGQCIVVPKDNSLLIPKGTMHSAYNFGKETVRVLAVIAPKIVEDQNFPTDTDVQKAIYNSSAALNSDASRFDEPNVHNSIRDLGKFPLEGELLRAEKIIYHIDEQKKLKVIHGDTRPILMKFSVSNDFMDLGEYIVPTGGVVARYSEIIKHEMESLIFCVDETPITVYFPDTGETHVLKSYDAIYIPPKTSHQLINYGNGIARSIFVVAKYTS